MVRQGLRMVVVQLFTYFFLVSALDEPTEYSEPTASQSQLKPTSPEERISCTLEEVDEDLETSDIKSSHRIVVQCGDESRIKFTMTDTTNTSELRLDDVRDGVGVEWLGVEYSTGSAGNDMFIIIDGDTYNVRDGLEKEENEKILKLFQEPDFKYFTTSVKVIHDELQLKGWESPAVMCLYTLALAAERFSEITVSKRLWNWSSWSNNEVDEQTYLYHGKKPHLTCKLNGWKTRYLRTLIRRDCVGICGPSCHTCWVYICGDCCYHKGCKRHDEFCGTYGFISADCISARGVLWDTLTDTIRDC